jgi:cobalt-zinc-cadmium efflux system membrane fusion protein
VKKIGIVILAAMMLAACSRNPQASAPAPKAEAPEPLRATVWTGKGELFLEYPALVVNQKVRFAVHLTKLSDFKAVKDAACEVRLARDANSELFPCDPSTHPGIFGVNVEPKSAGEARMSIVVHGKDLTETFDVGPVKIAADAASAEKPAEAKEETISFLKEQQWSLDFGTQLAQSQSLRDSLRVAAETHPRAGGEAAAIAPIAGRVAVERTFAVGTPVEKGASLASILPPTGAISTRRLCNWPTQKPRSLSNRHSAIGHGRSDCSRGGGDGASEVAGRPSSYGAVRADPRGGWC